MSKENRFDLLNKIQSPADLRKLSLDDLPKLCQQLRKDIIEEVAVNPGHLGSSLGATEITVACHYVFNTPEDRIVWDVGHQAYGHKILTGRRENFCNNRKLNGLMPFPSPLRASMIPLLVDMPLTLSRLPWAWLLLLTLRSSIVMSLLLLGMEP